MCSTVNEVLPLERETWAVKVTLPLSNPRIDASAGKRWRNTKAPTWASGGSELQYYNSAACPIHPSPRPSIRFAPWAHNQVWDVDLDLYPKPLWNPGSQVAQAQEAPQRVAGTCNLKQVFIPSSPGSIPLTWLPG